MIKIRVGGVPEHFNLAWHMAIEKKMFQNKGIDIEWKDVPGGTGAMCKALRENELDMAIALTEGIIADIIQGNPSKIVQFYVNSPLRWGIYTSGTFSINSVNDIEGKKYAISRYKSGSHLMAYVNAKKHKLRISEDDFVVVKDLNGAREALKNNDAQVFMWEKFTTKPLVDSGEFKLIGECQTPWPCFVIAARNEFIEEHAEVLMEVLSIINLSCMVLTNDSNAPALIASRYGIKEEDAMQWFKELEYACHPEMEELQMTKIVYELYKLRIIDHVPEVTGICFERNLELT